MIVDHRAAFLEDLQEQRSALSDPTSARAAAWDSLKDIELPSRRSELYKYFPLNLLYAEHFERAQKIQIGIDDVMPYVAPESKHSYIVFVNGYLDLELSCVEGIEGACIVRSLPEAMRSYAAFVQMREKEELKAERDPFALMHMALYQEGVFLYFPAKLKVEVPVQVLNLCVNRTVSQSVLPKVQIFVGKESEAHVTLSTHSLGSERLFSHVLCDIVLEANSRLAFSQAVLDRGVSWGFSSLRALVKEGAYLEGLHMASGGGPSRFDYRVDLVQPGAAASLNGVGLARGHQGVHTNVVMRHMAPETRSSQLFKGAVKDKGISAFEGKIFVDASAQKTDAFQLCNHLLLDDTAKGYAKPNLEIYADDVKASHGATAGPFDELPFFYAEARGLDKETIGRFLLRAFCKELEEKIEGEHLQRLFLHYLETFNERE